MPTKRLSQASVPAESIPPAVADGFLRFSAVVLWLWNVSMGFVGPTRYRRWY